MKKTLTLALALILVSALLTACFGNANGGLGDGDSTPLPTADNSEVDATTEPENGARETNAPDGDKAGLDESEYTWLETEYTKLIPKPEFGVLYLFYSADSNPLSAQIRDCPDGAIRAYMESVREMWKDGETVADTDWSLAIKRGGLGIELVNSGDVLTILISNLPDEGP